VLARPRRPWLSALLVTVGLLAACGDDTGTAQRADAPATPGSETAFPVTIEHAFGETVIADEPARVVTWGWGSADAAVALGVVPVAIPFEDYGGDDDGVLPWIRERLEDDGTDIPTVLPDAEDPPFEAIAAAQPDVILAVYSGITAPQFELLADIAPTVAYPGEAWSTPWRDTVELVGRALGRTTQAADLLADIDEQVAEQADAHPELAGKSVAMVWDTGDNFYVYKPADARVAFTVDLGLVSAPSVDALANGGSTFYFTLSRERLPELTSDILVSYADTPDASRAFLSSDVAQVMDQVRRGGVAEVVGTELVASVSPPTALSLTWGLDEYVRLLSRAVTETA